MKKTIDFLGWTSVVITIMALLCTLVTTYRFSYVEYFNSYEVLQICIISTMFFWSFKLYGTEAGCKKWAYSLICLLFAMATIFFMQNSVW